MESLEVLVLAGGRVVRRAPLTTLPFRIGSQARCELVLAEPGVRPHHATVYPGLEGGLEYRERGAVQVVPLGDGTHVPLGDLTLAFLAIDPVVGGGGDDRLLELVPRLWGEGGVDAFLEGVLEWLAETLAASWAAALELGADQEPRVLYQVGRRPGGAGGLSGTVLERLRAGQGPVLAADVLGDPELALAGSIPDAVRSVLAVPLPHPGGGRVLYLEGGAGHCPYGVADQERLERVAAFVERCLGRAREHARLEGLQRLAQRRDRDPEELLGDSPAMTRLRAEVARAAAAEVTTLILGESGTGKELVARALHQGSARRHGPFVAVHCMALAEGLVEAELFGHAAGAFTGASRERLGRFELAHGGTLFLDEVGELSPAVQVKLLRVLEARSLQRLGEGRERPVDIRLVAATNADLRALVAAGRFRDDLYFRLSVLTLQVPPLRARDDDVVQLAEFALRQASARHRRPFEGFAPGARAQLRRHPWPGNVRELFNVVEQAVIRGEGPWVSPETLGLQASPAPAPDPGGAGPDQLAEAVALFEAGHLRRILAEEGGAAETAARRLGISRTNLYRRCQHYDLRLKDFRKDQ